jgi:hypothetical protein
MAVAFCMHADQLRRAPLFAAMPAKVVDGLAALASRRRVRSGQRVRARGGDAVLVLLTGRLELVSDHGDEVELVRSLSPPAVVGLPGLPGAELWVAEDAELALVPADAVVAALRRHPEAALAAVTGMLG